MEINKMQLTDWLDDLSVRFIVNLPREELESVERICFQVEEAQWFYEDFVRPLNPNLPSLSLRQFSMKIFQHCPLFSGYGTDVHSKAFSEFLAYKTRVPVRGAIMLNETLDQVILVKGWKKGANWSFPRGKINKDERDIDCAIREVYEETGFDVRAAGLVGPVEEAKFIEVTMREQHMKLFVFSDVPMSTHFEPRTRKEISKIQWYRLSDLPTLKRNKQQQQQQQYSGSVQDTTSHANKFYMVAPFLNPLKKIISSLRKDRQAVHAAVATNVTQPEPHVTSPHGPHQEAMSTSKSDVARLMAQLRHSQQTNQDDTLPELSKLVTAVTIIVPASQKAPSPVHLGQSGNPQYNHSDAAVRESKASAMLSLLRGGSNTSQKIEVEPPPQTPMEQVLPPPLEPPPSPKQHTLRTNRVSDPPNSPRFLPFGWNSAYGVRRQPLNFTQPSLQHYGHDESRIANTNRITTSGSLAPYRQTGDPGFGETAMVAQGTTVVPPASRLPPPKLNHHSSTLLSLFKSPVIHNVDTDDISASGPFRQELSVSSPKTSHHPPHQSSLHINNTQSLHSVPAFVNPVASQKIGGTVKKSSQQEALLNLFRQPKPSPSLVPPEAPVELSAQGSPTHSRSSFDNSLGKQSMSLQNGKVTIQKRPSNANCDPHATVTGPVGVPQFGKILRGFDSGKGASTVHGNAKSSRSTVMPQQPIKILSRPSPFPNMKTDGSDFVRRDPHESSDPSQHQNSKSMKHILTDFHPQILKRPDSSIPATGNSPRTAPKEADDRLAGATMEVPQRTSVVDRRSSQSLEQKTALLALFGKQQGSDISPMPTRTAAMVSPMSEKPPTGSELPSPLGLNRSRLGSLQDGGFGREPSRSGGASPGDKKFLLGFLDGVVKENRK